jgi:hypothetical protein
MTIVNKTQLLDYISTYINTLLAEIKELNQNQRQIFEFHKEGPFHCIGFISEKHGAAVVFRPWDKEIIEIRRVKESIESLFPKDPSTGNTLIQTHVGPEIKYHRIFKIDANLELKKTYFLQKKNELAILNKGLEITVDEDSVYLIQDRLILKGDNNSEKWSKSIAVKDAFREIIRTLLNYEKTLPPDLIKELETRIKYFEKLINSSEVKESSLQTFFETNREFLQMGCMYRNIYPQIRLPRDEGDLVPDFFIERVKDGYCDILDIKLPDEIVIVGGNNRRKFSSHVDSAIAQVHEYSEYFNDPNKAKNIEEKYKINVYKPRIFVLIGIDSYPEERIKINSRYSNQIEIITYDQILNFINQLLDTLKKYSRI